jgi:hypothetical protein
MVQFDSSACYAARNMSLKAITSMNLQLLALRELGRTLAVRCDQFKTQKRVSPKRGGKVKLSK